MRIAESISPELQQEAATTRRVLERLPGDKLGWKPHPKAMSLGQLALHVATIPGNVSGMISMEEFQVPPSFDQPAATSTGELIPALDKSVAAASAMLNGLDDQQATAIWKVTRGSAELMALPRIVAIRSIMLNHWYHHRGQLSVYLRTLDVPLPSHIWSECRRESICLRLAA